MAVVRNTKRTFKSGGSSINDVIADYRKFVENIQAHAEEKVEEAVSTIANVTNTQYSGDNLDQRVQLTIDPIYYRMVAGKNSITGLAIAKPIPQFVYLELGTRQSPNDSLVIKTGWDSGIDVLSAAAPYKSQNPTFFNKLGPIVGRYYFLNTIDKEGNNFIKNFWK
jgi:hypothetical protein